jgi:uncharacterized protein (TIGR01777 family)
MKIVAAGASGFLGTRLTAALTAAGHRVTRLVRSDPKGPDESLWNPHSGDLDTAVLDGADAVINLCGAGVAAKRWTDDYKYLLVSSRVNPTRLLASECARLGIPVLINASAVGYYGPHGMEIVTEENPAGDTFLARLCVQWEAATAVARDADVRVVNLRTGLVLGKEGELLPKLTLLTKLMLGGTLGSGQQYFPWISAADEVAAMIHLLTAPVHGAVNLTGPYPVTNEQFTKELGRALGRPTPWIVPGFALHIVLGEFAAEVLTGQRALPIKLHESGFEFRHRTLPEALAAELA